MACPSCGRELAARDRFCPWCGAPQPAPPEPHAAASGSGETGPPQSESSETDPSDEELRQLRAAVNAMTSELARLSLRLSVLEQGRSAPGAPAPAAADIAAVTTREAANPAATTGGDTLCRRPGGSRFGVGKPQTNAVYRAVYCRNRHRCGRRRRPAAR